MHCSHVFANNTGYNTTVITNHPDTCHFPQTLTDRSREYALQAARFNTFTNAGYRPEINYGVIMS